MGTALPDTWAFMIQPCCGLQRRVPQGTSIGEPFSLVPCPKCGAVFYGTVHTIPSDLDPEGPLSLLVEQLPWPSDSRPAILSSGPSV